MRIELNNLILDKSLDEVIKILTDIKNENADKNLELVDTGIDECYLELMEIK